MSDSPAPGQRVLIRALKREGVILDILGQQYRVAVGALTMTCRRDEFEVVRAKAARRAAPSTAPPSGEVAPGASAAVVDLHGHTVEEARAVLLAHLDGAIRAGHSRVEVVHGIGTGRVRAAVLLTLRGLPSIRAVRAHPTNRGVTIVEL